MTKALRFFAALLVAFPLFAQARSYSQAELDQMLAPIALYPDPLLSQVLMASTYPAEIGEAARWSRAYPDLHGDDAVRAVEYEDWDPSVKSLLAFPQLLARMDGNPQWTRSLGEAFLAQEPHLMDTVQQLRSRARAAGHLQSSEHIHVQQQGQVIVVQPASPQYVYVPYYDPLVVYGPWWWPAYRPPVFVNRVVAVERGRWQHDPHRRRSQQQPAVRVQAQPHVRQEHRQEPRARMPAAQAPQTPRAERHERREARQEQRHERGHKGGDRS